MAEYLRGWAVLLALVAPAAWAAVEVRRWLFASWRGAWARLCEAVFTAVFVGALAEAAGTVAQLRALPLAAGGAVAAVAVAMGARSRPRRPMAPEPSPVRQDSVAVAGSAAVAVGVGAQWLAWTQAAYGQGMTAYDALFYHSPIALRFAQTADLTRLHNVVPGEAVAFYPATSELWHAIGIVAFHDDVVSPALNLAALAVAMLAGWCVGRRFGGAPAAVAGVGLVMAVPYMSTSQPGSSFNDIPALAALLAAAAFLARSVDDPVAGWPGGLAAGLAAGIKLSFLGPTGLVVLAAVAAAGSGRLEALARWAVAAFIAGGYWFIKNLVLVGNPLPGIRIPLLPSPALPIDARFSARLLPSLDLSGRGWGAVYHPGLDAYFARAWPEVLGLVAISIVVCLASRLRWHRAIGVVVVASLVVYALTPITGDPNFFGFNLRYSLPAQGLALVGLATSPVASRPWAQRLLVAAIGVSVWIAWLGPARHHSYVEFPGWPHGWDHTAAWTVAIAVALLLTAGGTARRRRPMVASLLAVAAGAGLVVAGRGVEDRYRRDRFVVSYRGLPEPAGLAHAWAWAQTVRGSRIGVVGVYEQYPFAGLDLSNVVQYVGVPTPHDGFARAPTCGAFRAAVNAGRYRYVVTSDEVILGPYVDPAEAGWLMSSPAAHQLLHADQTRVFRIDGRLGAC